jgi:AcrR family transcriptional regulator
MGSKRARKPEEITDRKREILRVCNDIYNQSGFDGVNMKSISEKTSFSRPTIYTYYKTKESILLDLLSEEYSSWSIEVERTLMNSPKSDKKKLCNILTDSVVAHDTMMKILCLNLHAMENNASMDELIKFKKAAHVSYSRIENGIIHMFPEAEKQNISLFLSIFFSYIDGVYYLAHPTEKQKEAMKAAGERMNYSYHDICLKGITLLSEAF